MVVFLGIQPGQVPEEPQPEGLDPFRDWQAACSALNRLICSVSGVQDPKDFPQTPGVEGIKALSQPTLQESRRRLVNLGFRER